MRTTLLPEQEVDYLRSIRAAAAVLLTMNLIDLHYPARSVKAEEISAILGQDMRTVEKHLRSLSARNRAIFDGTGYILTDLGRALLLSSSPQGEAHDLAHSQQVQAHPAENGGLPQTLPSGSGDGRIADPDAKNVAESAAHIVCSESEEEESLFLNLEIIDSSSPPHAQNVRLTTAQILAATGILFGEQHAVAARGLRLELIEPREALASVAHAYAERQTPDNPRGLQNPAGLVYVQLRDGRKAREQYRQAPARYLPNEYLEAIGLASYECEECLAEFSKKAELEQHIRAEHPESQPEYMEIDPAVHDHIPGGKISPFDAWRTVIDQLRAEMPKASFNTWVQDTRAIHYEDGILKIGTPSAYARDWLESRLTNTVERLLVGIMNRDVSVVFAVAMIDADGDD